MTALAKQKTITTGITVFLVILLHVFLWFSNISFRDFTKIYEKLDDKVWTQFLSRKIHIEQPKPEKPKPEKVERPEEKAEKTVAAPRTRIRREKFDPSKFADRLKLGLVRKPLQKSEAQTSQDVETSPFIQTKRSQFNRTQFKLLEGGAGTIPTLPRKTGTPANTKITAGQGTAFDDETPQFKGPGNAPDLPKNSASHPSLTVHASDRNKIEVSEIFKALIEWVKRHPVRLSPQLNQFLGFREGGLTSRVTFRKDRRNFEMFLLCFEENYEVRIALVEKNEVTYLVDQGFTKKGQKLRAGNVTRMPGSGEIATLGTKPLPIGHAKNEQFYAFFWYWWETVKHEVQK